MAEPAEQRYHWSRLNTQQLGQYAEYLAKMRMVEAGWEVYGSEVDDRGIDFLIRTGPGRCLDIQVKSVRLTKSTYVFVRKKHLGQTSDEIADRLRAGYALCLVVFHERREPEMFLIPGVTWLHASPPFTDYDYEGKKSAPEFGINISKKSLEALADFRLTNDSVANIVQELTADAPGSP